MDCIQRKRVFVVVSACLVCLTGCGGSDATGGESLSENGGSIPGGPGTPTITFTAVPRYGSFDDLQGQVLHVDPRDYKVAVFIYVAAAGGWWTKPYFAQPLTSIRSDGSWGCDVTTGGIDERASAIAAFLLPTGYAPPLLAGMSELPPILDTRAAAKVRVAR